MLIVMQAGATQAEIERVLARVRELGFTPHPIPGRHRVAVGITGNPGPLDPHLFEVLPGVKEAIPVSRPYKLVSRETHPESSVVEVGGVPIGAGHFAVIAGPCSVESREQVLAAARAARSGGAQLLRGGAFKPRTSPYAFQGLGRQGLELLAEARAETGLPVVTEALDLHSLEAVVELADCIQIGARSMQNFSLLREAGRAGKPVLLKRGLAATLEEWLMAAEYILSEGNRRVILCERGVRTFADHARNTLDVAAVPAIQRLSHLPVIVDPSHAAGIRHLVGPLALAGVAAGADGLMIEIHPEPERALSDGPQALTPAEFAGLMAAVQRVRQALAPRAEPAVVPSGAPGQPS
ncbi:MAG: 3-deoxy-7-phosphoheptulonate synthase [Planctomycetota bacterium]|nr:MAG: 3-deoxy-7-phosphoheptulonate synthase [Planctomycetota bacterium]